MSGLRAHQGNVLNLMVANAAVLGIGLHADWSLALYVWSFFLQQLVLAGFTVVQIWRSDPPAASNVAYRRRRPSPGRLKGMSLLIFSGFFFVVHCSFFMVLLELAPFEPDELGWLALSTGIYALGEALYRSLHRPDPVRPNSDQLMLRGLARILPVYLLLPLMVAFLPLVSAGPPSPIGFMLAKTIAEVLSVLLISHMGPPRPRNTSTVKRHP
jgi:hypothetical protein